jgi:hypothetical protein
MRFLVDYSSTGAVQGQPERTFRGSPFEFTDTAQPRQEVTLIGDSCQAGAGVAVTQPVKAPQTTVRTDIPRHKHSAA